LRRRTPGPQSWCCFPVERADGDGFGVVDSIDIRDAFQIGNAIRAGRAEEGLHLKQTCRRNVEVSGDALTLKAGLACVVGVAVNRDQRNVTVSVLQEAKAVAVAAVKLVT